MGSFRVYIRRKSLNNKNRVLGVIVEEGIGTRR